MRDAVDSEGDGGGEGSRKYMEMLLLSIQFSTRFLRSFNVMENLQEKQYFSKLFSPGNHLYKEYLQELVFQGIRTGKTEVDNPPI